MPDTLLDNLSRLITPELLGGLANQAGAPESAVSKGLSAVMPVLLGGVATRAKDPGFMSTLFGLITDSSNDLELVDKPQRLLGGAAGSVSAMALGGKLLDSLFGRQLDRLAGKVAGFAGISPAAVQAIFKFGAPVLLSMLGKKVKQDRLDANSLGKLLLGEKDKYIAAAPDALGGLQGFLEEPLQLHAAPPPMPEKKSIWRWLVPLLIALAVGWFLLQSMGGGDGTARRDAPPSMSLPSAANIYFDVDSAEIPAGTASQLMPIISYLKANPGSRANVTGYHDSSGDAASNEELARARAAAVGQALQAGGIDVGRINMAKPMISTGSGAPEEARRVEVSVSR